MQRTLPAHETCQHKNFRLTCQQYESLLAECRNECQACLIAAAETSLGKLVMDHDYRYGPWALRGLICSQCNSLFGDGLEGPYWALPYLTDPWFMRELARLGLSPEVPNEVSRDTYLRDFDDHVWFFEDGHWRWTWNKSPLLTWPELFYKFGPMALTPTTADEFRSGRGYPAYMARKTGRARWSRDT